MSGTRILSSRASRPSRSGNWIWWMPQAIASCSSRTDRTFPSSRSGSDTGDGLPSGRREEASLTATGTRACRLQFLVRPAADEIGERPVIGLQTKRQAQHFLSIDRLEHHEMQMRFAGEAGAAREPDRLADLHLVANFHHRAVGLEMVVIGKGSVRVLDDHVVAE